MEDLAGGLLVALHRCDVLIKGRGHEHP
jgi:hypothetical protein